MPRPVGGGGRCRRLLLRRPLVASLLAVAALLATPAAIADTPVWDPGGPGDQTIEATGPSGAVAVWTDPTASADPGDEPVTVNCTPGSGSTFAIGSTTVSCTATDANGDPAASDDTFTVTVQDTTPPNVSVPSNITTAATSSSGAVVTYPSASASDVVDGSVPVSCSPASGSTFPLGTTTVTCTATDSYGNTGQGSFSVTVQDNQPPTVTVPSPITTEATSPAGAAVTFSASASDLIDPSPSLSCAPPSGSTFPLGTTTVRCTATDSSGNSVEEQFTVTVRDTTPPSVTVPGTITTEATGPVGAVVTFSASASDLVDPSPNVSCSPSSGSTFPVTTTVVSCSATDASGNTSASKTFSVVVKDTTPPTVVVPADITQEATGATGAKVTFAASANDVVSGAISPTCSPASDSTFAIAVTTVTCTATDGSGNKGSASFRITVRDTKPPVLSKVPGDFTVEADGGSGSRVSYGTPSAADIVSGPVPVGCTPGSGSLYALGMTTVTCSAQDARGNTATASFVITVLDRTKPVLNVPRAETVSSHGAVTLARTDSQVAGFLAAAKASDLVDGAVAVKNDAPETLPLGTTRITFTATDRAGNTATGQSDLTVVVSPVTPSIRDTTPPRDVTRLRAKPGDRSVLLTWVPPKKDFDHLQIRRSPGRNGATESVVYRGSGKQDKDTRLKNGIEYRYVAVAFDAAGNASRGAVVRAVPVRPLLYAPADGLAISGPPMLRWAAVKSATYYNVQLYRVKGGKTVKPGAKILSAWPRQPRFALKRTWKYNRRKQRLTPGKYIWFAWPGFGAKSANRYGPLLGQSTFVVKRAR
jgi:hypothetical protein